MERGNQRGHIQVRSIYREKEILFTVVTDKEEIRDGDGFSVFYDFANSNYIPITADEAMAGGFYDRAYDSFKENFPIEFKEIFDYAELSVSINTPVLFNRKLDELVLKTVSHSQTLPNSRANDYYQLFLPFINNIPPDRLMEIRNKMPEAFLDFRNLMYEIIYDLQKSQIEPEMLTIKFQQKINPLVRKLDAEMKNSATRLKIFGAGIPVAAGLGTFGISHLGYDISQYAALIAGGANLLAGLGVVSSYLTDQRIGKANPVYYLWRVHQD